jgi:hypothetical protein
MPPKTLILKRKEIKLSNDLIYSIAYEDINNPTIFITAIQMFDSSYEVYISAQLKSITNILYDAPITIHHKTIQEAELNMLGYLNQHQFKIIDPVLLCYE